MVYRPKQAPTEAVAPEQLGMEREHVSLSWDGRNKLVDKQRLVLGRSRDCDVTVQDPNVSRRHAELRQEGATYWIVDLDSTNGTEVNGRRVQRAKLADGDVLTIGSTEVRFERRPE
jgi:pSer/pThr/pTyr-binding forkhead associated (FHA) protein